MECESELILTVPRDELGGAAIEFLRYSGGGVYSCRFVEALQDRLAGTEAAKVLDGAPVAYHLFRVPMGTVLAAELSVPALTADQAWAGTEAGVSLR